ncbi:NAD(P)-dependent oxidoreductase [Candidatus Pacearchaeota archaeon]|nr:NAD(P)-dependent oxidoreductase [Candidatus Pacearchaeota archaeon]|tara:strand:- start:355 stop:1242 length:888 start_codon:yes stop_codon:yes gene_type:complete
MKKIFITGGTGGVGSEVSLFLGDKYQVYSGTTNENAKIRNCKMILIDITDREKLIKTITEINPDYIIHLAALTDVNLCEEKKEQAWKINVEGTKNVTLAAERVGAKLIYASTNYVFDGEKGMYAEEDEPSPVNYYSLTKVKGEKEALNYSNSIVTRLCPFGLGAENRQTFTTRVIQELSKGGKINLFTDQFFSPIFTYNYVQVLEKLFESDFTGIINIAGSERLSRYEFVKKIADIFELDSNLLNPTKIEDLDEVAKRPRDTSLDISKAKSLFGDIFPDAESGIRQMKRIRDKDI